MLVSSASLVLSVSNVSSACCCVGDIGLSSGRTSFILNLDLAASLF
jgi:hypothetical protein